MARRKNAVARLAAVTPLSLSTLPLSTIGAHKGTQPFFLRGNPLSTCHWSRPPSPWLTQTWQTLNKRGWQRGWQGLAAGLAAELKWCWQRGLQRGWQRGWQRAGSGTRTGAGSGAKIELAGVGSEAGSKTGSGAGSGAEMALETGLAAGLAAGLAMKNTHCTAMSIVRMTMCLLDHRHVARIDH